MSNNTPSQKTPHPEILAPAGDTQSFLAALAAGADAIYLGLKNFSARMEAENFGLHEVSQLTELAHGKKARVYIAMNTMLKQEETHQAYRLLARLDNQIHCDGIIVQDLAFLDIVRQSGFHGGVFLSTLANITHPEMLSHLPALGVSRVILPRELSLDEIRIMGERCPDTLDLELFVQGALCYCVSGRCYWSSYLGGKSGLRGRCVQPCRRLYTTGGKAKNITYEHERQRTSKEQKARFFSCQDLSIDTLAASLLDIPHLCSWKIEGRKKGPHYVYHCVAAYKLLRDAPHDDKAVNEALKLLKTALGRPVTRARLLPQKKCVPTNPSGITSSGLLIGHTKIEEKGCAVRTHIPLLNRDFLRIGTEEMQTHQTLHLTQNYNKNDLVPLRVLRGKVPPNGTAVFLIDRREKALSEELKELFQKLKNLCGTTTRDVHTTLKMPQPLRAKRRPDMRVLSQIPQGRENRAGSRNMLALWLSPKSVTVSSTVARRVFWWLPPVVWPDESAKIGRMIRKLWLDGCRHFVLNAPSQRAFFPEILSEGSDLIAGPFCNLANALSIDCMAKLGCKAAFVSQELTRETLLSLPKVSTLPLGFVLEGFWPVGISRFGLMALKENTPCTSPKGEVFWARKYGQNVWLYPSWPLNLRDKEEELLHAGYSFFATLQEIPPANIVTNKRPGLFNWAESLL